MLRKLRAALVIATLWVLWWVPFGIAAEHVLVDIFIPEPRIDSPYMDATTWVIWGALSGLCFAAVLGFGERGRAVSNLSTLRVLMWGAAGSTFIPILYSLYMFFTWPRFPSPASVFWLMAGVLVFVSAVLGTICAAFTLALMRGSLARSEAGRSGAV